MQLFATIISWLLFAGIFLTITYGVRKIGLPPIKTLPRKINQWYTMKYEKPIKTLITIGEYQKVIQIEKVETNRRSLCYYDEKSRVVVEYIVNVEYILKEMIDESLYDKFTVKFSCKIGNIEYKSCRFLDRYAILCCRKTNEKEDSMRESEVQNYEYTRF